MTTQVACTHIQAYTQWHRKETFTNIFTMLNIVLIKKLVNLPVQGSMVFIHASNKLISTHQRRHVFSSVNTHARAVCVFVSVSVMCVRSVKCICLFEWDVSVCSMFSSLFSPVRPAVSLITQRTPGVLEQPAADGWAGEGVESGRSGGDERSGERKGITG